MFKPLERYAGLYVQVITEIESGEPNCKVQEAPLLAKNGDSPVRYSILDIHYHRKDDKYVLKGSQYDHEGGRTVIFISNLVGMKKDVLTSIEFVWKTEIVGNPTPSLETTKYDGYTEMTFVDSDPPETAQGSGFYIGFRPNAKKFNFWFARLTDLRINIEAASD